ncbi:hypothetical protein [Edaphobacter sp. HDX4]
MLLHKVLETVVLTSITTLIVCVVLKVYEEIHNRYLLPWLRKH